MQAQEENSMALDEQDLRAIDLDLLEYLREGRVTPIYARDRMVKESKREVTSTYIGQRLQRLEEHDHVQNLLDSGMYELVDDPVGKLIPICEVCGSKLDEASSDKGEYFCSNCNITWPKDDVVYVERDGDA